MKPKLYVKKLWSTHPDLFLYLELDEALFQHHRWSRETGGDKSFENWLSTEIDTQPRENQKCKCCGGRFK